MAEPQDPWKRLLDQQVRPTPISEVALAGSAGGGATTDAGPSTPPPITSVPRLHASQLTYERFCLDFMEPNLPLVIQGATEGWPAAFDWAAPEGGINLDFLRRRFGAALVTATDSAREHEGSGPCRQMALSEYLDWWQRHQEEQQQKQQGQEQEQRQQQEHWGQQCSGVLAQPQPMSAPAVLEAAAADLAASTTNCGDTAHTPATTPGTAASPLWYCKDWHLASEFPQYQAYRCPSFFQDDWLNEFYGAAQHEAQQEAQQAQQEAHQAQHQAQHQAREVDQQDAQQPEQRLGLGPAAQLREDPGQPVAQQAEHGQQPSRFVTSDYRFVYMGPRGTCTPLHSDVLRSFSWSANVVGRKLWRLLPPWHSHLLLDRHGRHPAWDFFAPDPEGLYPGLAEARGHLITVEQQAGEAIFVPSGWFHTVENLEDCVSINHNWANGHNVHWVWALLQQERRAAEAGIDDCRELCSPVEFEGLVQRNLGANAGLDYAGLGALLRCTAAASLPQLAAARAAAAALPKAAAAAARAAALTATPVPAAVLSPLPTAAVAAPTATALPAEEGSASAMLTGSGGSGLQIASGVRDLEGCWYHAFRLARAALVLQELTAEERQIGDTSLQQQQLGQLQQGIGRISLQHQQQLCQQQRWRQQQRQQQQGQQGGLSSGGGEAEQHEQGGPSSGGFGGGVETGHGEAAPHAGEVAANGACLARISLVLQELGIAVA